MQFAYQAEKLSDRRIKAIVSYYTYKIQYFNSENYPSILFLPGDKDVEMLPSPIYKYCDLLIKSGRVCEAVIYPGGKHAFNKKSYYNGYDPKLQKDAYNRTLEYLNKYLDNKITSAK